MGVTMRYDLECVIRKALPGIKSSLKFAELELDCTDEEIIQRFVNVMEPDTQHVPKVPEPLPRHEECLDCDALIDIHRDGGTHCDVCGEDWPCEHACEFDMESVARLRKEWAKLRATHRRTPNVERRMNYIARRLEAEGLGVTED